MSSRPEIEAAVSERLWGARRGSAAPARGCRSTDLGRRLARHVHPLSR